MKTKPILFSGEMVRAILDGRKTQTRRIIKPQPIPFGESSYGGTRQGWKWKPESLNRGWNDDDKDPYRGESLATAALACECPHGKAGDRLWVKETFFDARPFMHEPLFAAMEKQYIYRADYDYREGKREPSVIGLHHWKPSIFCTRKASRITLEIVAVRVERLQDISQNDAEAEGCEQLSHGYRDYSGKLDCQLGEARTSYFTLWESINGVDSWDKNPWVFVIEFKRV